MKQKKSSITITKKMLISMIFLICIQMLTFSFAIIFSGIGARLNQNSFDMVSQKLSNRGDYIENLLVKSAINASAAATKINSITQEYLETTHVEDKSKIATDETCYNNILMNASDILVTSIRENNITGAFVVLNTDESIAEKCPGLYIIDSDPQSRPSKDDSDLFLLRAPIYCKGKLEKRITTSDWKTMFTFSKADTDSSNYLSKPFLKSYNSPEISSKELGYWNAQDNIEQTGRSVLTYTLPLVLKDGTPFGILGIEYTLSYLARMLPSDELFESRNGSYLLGYSTKSNEINNVLISGGYYAKTANGQKKTLIDDKPTKVGAFGITSPAAEEPLCITQKNIQLYNTNTPFESEQWSVSAILRSSDLTTFKRSLLTNLGTAIVVVFFLGSLLILLVSFSITNPVIRLSKELKNSPINTPLKLSGTGIRELDDLALTMENLSLELHDSATKFSSIIKMASIKIGVFEINKATNALFITDNFFSVLCDDYLTSNLTVEKLYERLSKHSSSIITKKDNDSYIMFYKEIGNSKKWIELKVMHTPEKIMGLIEDVTMQMLEKQKIEYERDFDSLTGLINRGAFIRLLDTLFEDTCKIKIGAMIMFDLDGLKYINDIYGHDYGDSYIKTTANCLTSALADYPDCFISRISGDEFYIFLYGFSNKADILTAVQKVSKEFEEKKFLIHGKKSIKVNASGGIAWYPYDSDNYDLLMKYSDFAMYKVKHTTKGKISQFNKLIYEKESFILQSKEDLTTLIEEDSIYFVFQPIIDAHTGEIFAFEALMRSNVPKLSTPYEILMLARIETRLADIERMTIVDALRDFRKQMECGNVQKGCKLFLNSIPNQSITTNDVEYIEKYYSDIIKNVVVEITEEERTEHTIAAEKYKIIDRLGCEIAIDDYGSGYNSELILLKINPAYIKIDIDIVRNIEISVNKQKVVENIISYCHERNIKVIAEGTESRAEVVKLISMGVDYFQGFYFAHPQKNTVPLTPMQISDIKEMNTESIKI